MSELFLVGFNDASALEINKNEIKRYLSICKSDTQCDELISWGITKTYEVAKPRAVYFEDKIAILDNEIRFSFDTVESKNLSKNLCGCQKAYVFCATLGIEVDRLIQRYAKIEPSKSVVLNSVASALIEEFCDYINNLLKEKSVLCPRFSAGYGDFSITHQKKILDALDASKKLGVSLTESYMMTPTKTVTAVVGIKNEYGE